ncbi:MAG: TRAFs-binding domain-containing protein [Betaproteobacteria bacterium]
MSATPPGESAAAKIRTLLAASQNLAAVEHARAALHDQPDSAELAYLYALACVRSGAAGAAWQTIVHLRAAAGLSKALRADVESLAGRLAKDRFLVSRDEGDRARALADAIDAYRQADVLHPNVHARINAATLLRVSGAGAEAKELASLIQAQLNPGRDAASHWDCATLGEAALLAGDMPGAIEHYRDANRLAGKRYGDIASMRRQLSLLAGVLPEANLALAQIPGPTVIAFSGHMIDTDDRPSARFPASLEVPVRDAIDRRVAGSCPAIAYTQAACGSDILFCEIMLAHGQEFNIVLPFARDDYVAQSVLPGGVSWVARFERVMAAATSVTFATEERYLGDDTLFEHASHLIQGMAFLRAKELAVDPCMLVVADSLQAGGIGGTLATQSVWADQARAVEIIDLADIRASRQRTSQRPVDVSVPRMRPAPQRLAGGGRTIKTLLFADVKGFSRLAEEFFPTFFTTFLGLVPKTLHEIGVEPLEISSRGDGLYAVFATPEEGAHFALSLSAAIGAIDWASMGLPADTHVRIALHAGPVFTATDPVTGKLAHYGAHVTRAARVEPVVIPGQVLVTEPFAAVLAARPGGEFTCDLVGTEPLAKSYGAARLYRLREK